MGRPSLCWGPAGGLVQRQDRMPWELGGASAARPRPCGTCGDRAEPPDRGRAFPPLEVLAAVKRRKSGVIY